MIRLLQAGWAGLLVRNVRVSRLCTVGPGPGPVLGIPRRGGNFKPLDKTKDGWMAT